MVQSHGTRHEEVVPSRFRTIVRTSRRTIRDIMLTPEKNYRFYLKHTYKINGPTGYPQASWSNAVLGNRQEWESAVRQIETLGLPLREDLPKNWDSLAALDCILSKTNTYAKILDAGAEVYSVILPWLYLYGYKQLTGINPIFKRPLRRGPIRYEYGNITQTNFKNNMFDAISCISVIEHGVNIRSYFKEVSRILKPNGILITSTDYYSDPIDTRGQSAYGAPLHIFSRDEIMSALNIAKEYNLEMISPINLDSQEKPIRWEDFDLNYTFIVFTLQKMV